MQTFLPHPDYYESAKSLDDKRLKNQVKECAQIMASLLGGAYIVIPASMMPDSQFNDGETPELALYSTGGYPAHPATLMWKAHERELAVYALCCIVELRRRGSTAMKVYEKMFKQCSDHMIRRDPPDWLGDERMHSAHRSQLLKKDPEHYGQFGWTEEPGAIDYWWPTKENAA